MYKSPCYLLTTARMSRALSSNSSLPSYLTSVPPYLLKITTSPSATSSGTRLPLSSIRPGPVARTLPSCGFSLAVSGMTRPDAVVCSASSGSTRIRSSSGLIVTDTSNPFHRCMCGCLGGRNVVAVPLRPTSPFVSWHTPGESANPTLALDPDECQHRLLAGQPSRSATNATVPAGVRDTIRVAAFGPASRSSRRSRAGSTVVPRCLISSRPTCCSASQRRSDLTAYGSRARTAYAVAKGVGTAASPVRYARWGSSSSASRSRPSWARPPERITAPAGSKTYAPTSRTGSAVASGSVTSRCHPSSARTRADRRPGTDPPPAHRATSTVSPRSV